MTLQELIDLYRAQADDRSRSLGGCDDDALASDAVLTIYANEAEAEACRRGQLLRDSYSAMCTIPFAAGDESVAFAPQIVRILRAAIDSKAIDVFSAEEMDCFMPGWEFQDRRDAPQRLVTGMSTGRLNLWPRPAAPGVLRLTVQRLPLKPMRDMRDKPEIRPELHPALAEWMLYRVYSSQDTELYNDAKAALCLRRFEEEFGRKSSGRNEQWVRSRDADMMPGPIA